MSAPLLSVLIPVYNAESTLLRCLKSAAEQTYANVEVIVVNDGSPGADCDGRSAAQIVKAFAKEHKAQKGLKIRYAEHKHNMGLIEARRTCFQESSGEYCCFLDSDDMLEPQGLALLYEEAQRSGADIVQGTACVMADGEVSKERLESNQKKARLVYKGILEGPEIADSVFCVQAHPFFLWGKLFKSSLLKKAYKQIPFVQNTLAEDLLQYYFITRRAGRYSGIQDAVYKYNVSSGITSGALISSLARWEKICSASAVFTVLYSEFKNDPPPENQKLAIQKLCLVYLMSAVRQLHTIVAPELYIQAYSMLCDYWGKSFVEKAEMSYKRQVH